MSDLIPRLTHGGRLASIVDAHNSAADIAESRRIVVDGEGSRGRSGQTVATGDETIVGVYEITSRWVEVLSSNTDYEPAKWWKCFGRLVWVNKYQDGWVKADRISSMPDDGIDDHAEDKVLWHPQGFQTGTDVPDDMLDGHFFMPKFGVGDWVWCIANPASGRWEIIENFEDIVRVKLSEDLNVGSWSPGLMVIYQTNPDYDESDDTSPKTIPALAVGLTIHDGLGHAREIIDHETASPSHPVLLAAKDTYIHAKYYADSEHWEYLDSAPAEKHFRVFNGTLNSDLARSDTDGYVTITEVTDGGDLPDPVVVSATNRLLCKGKSGNFCTIWYNIQTSAYEIIAAGNIEPYTIADMTCGTVLDNQDRIVGWWDRTTTGIPPFTAGWHSPEGLAPPGAPP